TLFRSRIPRSRRIRGNHQKAGPAGRRAPRLSAPDLRISSRRRVGSGGARMNHPVADPKSGQIQVETETLLQIEIQSESQTTVLNSATESPRQHAVPAHHHKIGVLPA